MDNLNYEKQTVFVTNKNVVDLMQSKKRLENREVGKHKFLELPKLRILVIHIVDIHQYI